jgi:hypothetical protein
MLAAGLVAAALTPFVAVAIPPMTDLAQHVLVGHILLHFDDATLRYADYFAIDAGLRPLVLPHLLLAALQSFAGPLGGAKLYLALFVALTYLASRAYLVAAGSPRPTLVAAAVLPVCLSGLVYMGFLPFLLSFPLYAWLLAFWLRREPSAARSLGAAALLVALFVCHLVGAVVGATAIGVMAVVDAWRRRPPLAVLARDLAALVPVGLLVLWFLLGSDHPSDLHLRFQGPVQTLRSLLFYNVRTLSDVSSAIHGLALAAFVAAALVSIRRGGSDPRILATMLALGAAAVITPIAIGILWPAGPRVFPFALISALPLVRPTPRGARVFAVSIAAVVLLGAGFVLRRSLEIDRDYARFLAGAEAVAPGSKLLPVIDTGFDAAGPIAPFWSIASLYTVLRGGSHPYVFARPYWKTGGDLLRYRDYASFSHAFLYQREVAPERYRGVAQAYDFAVVWGPRQPFEAVLADELPQVFEDGLLRVYGRPAARAER